MNIYLKNKKIATNQQINKKHYNGQMRNKEHSVVII